LQIGTTFFFKNLSYIEGRERIRFPIPPVNDVKKQSSQVTMNPTTHTGSSVFRSRAARNFTKALLSEPETNSAEKTALIHTLNRLVQAWNTADVETLIDLQQWAVGFPARRPVPITPGGRNRLRDYLLALFSRYRRFRWKPVVEKTLFLKNMALVMGSYTLMVQEDNGRKSSVKGEFTWSFAKTPQGWKWILLPWTPLPWEEGK
jgi:hypothetical protein